MKIEVYFSDAVTGGVEMHGAVVVVVDVLRATSTMIEALANGARAIYPRGNAEEAIRLYQTLGREDTLLCGERRGVKVEGYDLGNSPGEFTRDRVGGKHLVMSTTNGTRALAAAQGAARVVVASFLNLSAVAGAVAPSERLVVLCAGREGHFSLDDAVCAGYIVRGVLERAEGEPVLGDGARGSVALAGALTPDPSFLRNTTAGEALVALGLEADLELCAEIDRHALVPVMHDRTIRVADVGP